LRRANGAPGRLRKIERYDRAIKSDSIRKKTPLTLDEARDVVTEFVIDYNSQRLHSAIGYVTPWDMRAGRQNAIHEERDRKLAAAREQRAKDRATVQTKEPEETQMAC
jgi:putative transposase